MPNILRTFPLLGCSLLLAACGAAQHETTSAAPAASAPAAATLANPKIAPALAAMARKVRAAPDDTLAKALSTRFVRVNGQGEIQVYIHVSQLAPAVEQTIADAGASDIRPSKPLGLYQAWTSPAALARIADLAAVTKITPPVYGFPRNGGR